MIRVVPAVIVLGLLAMAGWLTRPVGDLPAPDVVTANDFRARTVEHWGELDLSDYPPGPDFTVFDASGAVILSRGAGPEDEVAAARERAVGLPVVVEGRTVGRVAVRDDSDVLLGAAATAERRTAAVGLLVAALAVSVLWLWLEARILRPFSRLQRFATDVAAGDLDAPLATNRARVFGAFSEAFDLMRNQLREARAAEAEAVQARKDLVAELSHDVRTPIASIIATTELLALHNTDPTTRSRLDVVLAKAEQIAELADDLSAAGAAGSVASIEPETIAPERIHDLIRRADTSGAVSSIELPAVLVRADPLRLSQVFDNILVNAEKYAATPVTVSGRTRGEDLVICFADTGPGLPAEELTAVLGRGVWGSGSTGISGQGLGLFNAAGLLERMNGDIELTSAGTGLQVHITLPLET